MFGKTLSNVRLAFLPVEAFRIGAGLSRASSAWPRSRRHSGWGWLSCWMGFRRKRCLANPKNVFQGRCYTAIEVLPVYHHRSPRFMPRCKFNMVLAILWLLFALQNFGS